MERKNTYYMRTFTNTVPVIDKIKVHAVISFTGEADTGKFNFQKLLMGPNLTLFRCNPRYKFIF